MLLLVASTTRSYAEPAKEPAKKTSLEQLEKIAASEFTKIIDQSQSPNKRLAVGVGSLDGSKPVWEELFREEDGNIRNFMLSDTDACGNYLIDVQANRVTGVLDGIHFGTGKNYNHESSVIVWSDDGRWLIEVQSWKWQTAICTVHQVSVEGRLLGRFDLKKEAERIVSKQLLKQFPKLSPEKQNRYAVTISDPGISNDGTLTIKILADIPKDLEAQYMNLVVVAKLEQTKDGNLSAKVSKIELVKEENRE